MAQTIALQRGTASLTCDGSTLATLFTQSGGTATRVISNQLTFTFTGAADTGGIFVGVYLASSGGQTSMIGLLKREDASSQRAVQFTTGAFTDNSWVGGTLGTQTTFYPTGPALGHTQTPGGSGDMGAVGPQFINVVYSNTSNIRFSNLPSNFYMGPGDAIKVKITFSSSSGTVSSTISYSFTTITES